MNRRLLSAVAILALTVSMAVAQEKKAAAPEPTVKIGETAPDFSLLDQNRKPVKLSDFRGKKSVVLAFYVFAFTGG